MRRTDSRLVRHQKSTLALYDLICQVARDPDPFTSDADLFDALKTQRSLAAFDRASAGIEKCSLNTLKTVSERLIPGGWETLDNFRERAQEAILEARKPSKGPSITKASLVDRLDTQFEELELLKQTIAALSNELIFVIDEIGIIASHTNAAVRQKRAHELQDRLRLQFGKFRSSKIIHEGGSM